MNNEMVKRFEEMILILNKAFEEEDGEEYSCHSFSYWLLFGGGSALFGHELEEIVMELWPDEYTAAWRSHSDRYYAPHPTPVFRHDDGPAG